MAHVTKESLTARIAELESGARSLKEDYTLAAYKMLLATMEAEPVALHMGEAINVFNALKVEQLSERVNNAGLGPMGASNVQVWTSKAGGRLEFISANGGCTLNIFPQPAPVVPDEMTIRDACKFVQDMRLFDDVSVIVMRTWNACRSAMKEVK